MIAETYQNGVLVNEKNTFIYKNFSPFPFTFFIVLSVLQTNKYQLLEQKYPKSNLKISMVISCVEGSVKILPVEKEFKVS